MFHLVFTSDIQDKISEGDKADSHDLNYSLYILSSKHCGRHEEKWILCGFTRQT